MEPMEYTPLAQFEENDYICRQNRYATLMPRYPIGLQNFRSLREGGYVYVDKTDFIRLLLDKKYFFLSRPRRFGKSLFLSTLAYFFRGCRELFRGLSIDDYPDWDWAPLPVVYISFVQGDFLLPDGLAQRIDEIIDFTAKEYGVEAPGATPRARFRSLILALYEATGREVVVLVDEYDKPLLDAIDDTERLRANRELLSSFFSVIKDSDEYLRMAFLTGVTRFGHLNIFSGLNNLQDISLDDRYSSICGITNTELLENFQEGIAHLAAGAGVDFAGAIDMLKAYYDGYHFSAALIDVYNPYSLITALDRGEVGDIWAHTGNSAYLLRQLRKENFDLFELEGSLVDKDTLEGSDPEYSDALTLLYQSGYLTIKALGDRPDEFILGLPNHEVTTALYKSVIPFYMGATDRFRLKDSRQISDWLENGDVEAFMRWLKEFFARVTYDVKLLPVSNRLRQESDFQFVVFCILSLACGLDSVRLEEPTSHGHIDLTVETGDYVYIFEFKMGDDAEEAIAQIIRKGYADRWAADRRHVVMVGVSFSPETRGISSYAIRP